jgi:tetratricopeptide (TPR) repeat protein
VRGLRNLVLVLNRAGRYDEALVLCDRLETECGDSLEASAHRAAIYLNTGRWQAAAEAAGRLVNIWASENFAVAFASFELGKRDDAASAFLHAALNHPRAARMLLGERTPSPKTGDEVEDHNTGVQLLRSLAGYFGRQNRAARKFFGGIIADPRVVALQAELQKAIAGWRTNRSDDRKHFDKMNRMKSPEFARLKAGEPPSARRSGS